MPLKWRFGPVLLRDISCTFTIALLIYIPSLPAPHKWYKRIHSLQLYLKYKKKYIYIYISKEKTNNATPVIDNKS